MWCSFSTALWWRTHESRRKLWRICCAPYTRRSPRRPRAADPRGRRGRNGRALAFGIYLTKCIYIYIVLVFKAYIFGNQPLLPCIWPTVNVRSRPSMLASRSSFGTRISRNIWLRPENQPDQNFSDFARSTRQVYLSKKTHTHTNMIMALRRQTHLVAITFSCRWHRVLEMKGLRPPRASPRCLALHFHRLCLWTCRRRSVWLLCTMCRPRPTEVRWSPAFQ